VPIDSKTSLVGASATVIEWLFPRPGPGPTEGW
jgi:hypothetical protein